MRKLGVWPIVTLVAAVAGWTWFVQGDKAPRFLVVDLLALAAGFLATRVLLSKLQTRYQPVWAVVLTLVVAWLAVSALQPVLRVRLATDGGRFEQLRSQTSNKVAHGKAIGVSLSGGGYRAAVYHAGVLDGLEQLGIVPTHLVTVSGGSIIGLYYAHGGKPADFRDAVARGAFNLRRELAMAQNLLRLPLPDVDRLTVQGDLLRQTLLPQPGKSIACPSCPLHMVAVTDLNFGLQAGLVQDKILLLDTNTPSWRMYRALPSFDRMDTALRVAVSGAFPGVFPARPMELDIGRAGQQRLRQLLLSDGGVADNTGLLLLHAAAQEWADWSVNTFIASDAGAIEGFGRPVHGFDEFTRAIDILGGRPHAETAQSLLLANQLANISPKFCVIGKTDVFTAPHVSITQDNIADVEGYTWFLPTAFPDSILKKLMDVVRPGNDSRADLNQFVQLRQDVLPFPPDASRAKQITFAITRTQGPGCGVAPGAPPLSPQEEKLRCAGASLRHLVRSEVMSLCQAFMRTPTLEDQLGPKRVGDLYRLGQLQTLLRWPSLGLVLTGRPLADPDAKTLERAR